MIQFDNPFTQFVFAHTLAHMMRVEKPPKACGLTEVTFATLMQRAMTDPETMLTLSVMSRDIDDSFDFRGEYVAKEFGFTYQPVDSRISETSHIVEFFPRGVTIHGVWHNHGTSAEPRWGSHT